MKSTAKAIVFTTSLIIGCDGILPIEESKKETKDESAAIEEALNSSSFYIGNGQLKKEGIPEKLRETHSLYHIALQDGDQPILGAIVDVNSQSSCERPDDKKESTSVIAQATMSKECTSEKIASYGPNNRSNYFSLVLAKDKSLDLAISSPGYFPKYLWFSPSQVDLIVLTIKLDAESTCYENRIDQPHIGSGVIEGAESGVANLNMPTTAPYWCDTPDGGGYPDDRIEETAFGYNIAKEYVQCDVKPAAECPAIYGEPHAFADQCREEGHTAISCSCSQFLCTGKIDFKGFNP